MTTLDELSGHPKSAAAVGGASPSTGTGAGTTISQFTDNSSSETGVSRPLNDSVTKPISSEHGHQSTEEERRAAIKIQRVYRGHRERRGLKGLRLTADERWMDAVGEALYRSKARPLSRKERETLLSSQIESETHSSLRPPEEKDRRSSCGSSAEDAGTVRHGRALSPSRDRWERAAFLARMVQHDDPDNEDVNDDGDDEGVDAGNALDGRKGLKRTESEKQKLKEKKQKKKQELIEHAKAMDAQYFLELVDLKHRYGANLKVYHDYWKVQETDENFFYWLDMGSGKEVNLTACPRDQLDREKVRYLSREERQAYLVKIDKDGRLCWAKNDERIDTSEKYKNSKHGIVPLEEGDKHHLDLHGHTTRPGSSSSSSSSSTSSSSSSSSSSSTNSDEAKHYANHESTKKAVFHFSPIYILNRLLRKTTKKNTWIFVADTSFRLYVGIKQSGAFQHSSFLHGARVSAAGLIKIKDGKLKRLSPLSGHYRPPASNFRQFLKSLEEAKVDMSNVAISKSYAVLIGLEAYSKFKQEQKKAKERLQEHHPHLSVLHHGKRRDASPSSAGHTTADDTTNKKNKEHKEHHLFMGKKKKAGKKQEGETGAVGEGGRKSMEEKSGGNERSFGLRNLVNSHRNVRVPDVACEKKGNEGGEHHRGRSREVDHRNPEGIAVHELSAEMPAEVSAELVAGGAVSKPDTARHT